MITLDVKWIIGVVTFKSVQHAEVNQSEEIEKYVNQHQAIECREGDDSEYLAKKQ